MNGTPILDATGVATCTTTCPQAVRPWPNTMPDLVFCHGCDSGPQTTDGAICIPFAIEAMQACKTVEAVLSEKHWEACDYAEARTRALKILRREDR